MFRIDNATSVATRPATPTPGTPGYFTGGDPVAAIPATVVDAWWANMLQEEIIYVISAAGITLDKTANHQLYDALTRLFQGAGATGNFLPLTGGTLYHAANSNLLTIQTDANLDNYITFTGTRRWLIGVGGAANVGDFNIYDGTAGRWCMQIDTTGNMTVDGGFTTASTTQRAFFTAGANFGSASLAWIDNAGNMGLNGNFNINGNASIGGTATISSNRVNVSGSDSPGIAFFNSGGGGPFGIWNSSSALQFGRATGDGHPSSIYSSFDGSGNATFAAALTVNGRCTVSDFQSNQNVYVPNGWGHFQTGVYIGNLPELVDGGNNWLNYGGNFHANGQLIVDGYAQFGGDTYANGLVTGKNGGSFGQWNVGGTNVTIGWDCNLAGGFYSGGSVSGSNARLQSGAQPGGGGASELWMNSSNAAKYGTMWIDLSDARIKDDIQPFERGLADIRQLRATTYRYNGAHGTFVDGKCHTGLIAQEVQEVMPEMVGELGMTMVPLEEPILTLDCGPLFFAMLNAIKELAQRLEALENPQ